MSDKAKFKDLIKGSKRILITSHVSPDPDAIASVLLLGRTLRANFKGKDVHMVLEERPARDLSFLIDYDKIKFDLLATAAEKIRPDLFIMLDAMNLDRVSRSDDKVLRQLLKDFGAKLIIIDHHTEAALEVNNLYINDQLPATVQQIYSILFDDIELEKPSGYAETVLLGIISDTARFKYDNPHHEQTFKVVSGLLNAGASIENLESRLDRYTKAQMEVFSNLAKNITDSGDDYSYSFIDDGLDISDSQSCKMACEIFTSEYLRKFESNLWGFIVYPEIVSGEKTYSVSFRSVNQVKDVAKIAARLGGGGHKAAAGAKKIQARTVREAIEKVVIAISRP